MRGKVKLGNIEVGMAANAATPIIFNQVFHIDLLRELTDADVDKALDVFTRLAFIMANQDQDKSVRELMSLTEDDFFEWLQGFEPTAFFGAINEIKSIYFGNKTSTSNPKAKAE